MVKSSKHFTDEEYLASLKKIETFNDGRASFYELTKQYDLLKSKYGFIKEPVYTVNIDSNNEPVEVTVFCYKSAKKGEAIWLLAGIHGEEPTGPNAIARNIDTIGKLGQETPIVIYPLLNAKGYVRDDRYPDEHRDWHLGHSVSDSEHYLHGGSPGSEIAAKVTRSVLENLNDYPPTLTVDLHEDELLDQSYVYSQGPKGAKDEAARKAVSIFEESSIPIKKEGLTRFPNEFITEGVVADENGKPVKDGSIDELLSSKLIFKDKEMVKKPFASTSLVIETPTIGVPLEKRIKAHSNIIKALQVLQKLANK
jgi:hypothetical protein